jgi:hypothetical protein
MYKEMRYLHVENVALTQFKGGRGSIQKKEEEENVCSKKRRKRKMCAHGCVRTGWTSQLGLRAGFYIKIKYSSRYDL